MNAKSKQEHIEFFSKQTASQIFKVLDAVQKEHGYDFVMALSMNLLQRYIFVMSMNVLNMQPKTLAYTEEELQEVINRNFSKLKGNMQNSLAEGVGLAQGKYEGREIEYYCQLTPIHQPANKEPC